MIALLSLLYPLLSDFLSFERGEDFPFDFHASKSTAGTLHCLYHLLDAARLHGGPLNKTPEGKKKKKRKKMREKERERERERERE